MKLVIKSKKKLIRLLLIAASVLGVVGAAGYTLLIQPNLEKDTYIYKEAAVAYGDLQVGVMESGSIETKEKTQKYELDLMEDSEGDTESTEDDVDISEFLKFEKTFIVVGQRVSAGEALFQLAADSVETVRRKLELGKAEAETALAEAELSSKLDTLEAAHTYQGNTFEGAAAQGDYDISIAKLNNEIKDYNVKIAACEAKIKSLGAEMDDSKTEDDGVALKAYENAKKEYDKADKNNERTFVAIQDTYLKAKDKYDTYVSSLEALQEQVNEQTDKIKTYQMNLTNAQTQINVKSLEAKQEYETNTLSGSLAQSTYNYSEGSLEEGVADAQTDLAEANEKLEDFETFVGDGTVYAKEDGLITKVNYKEGDAMTSLSDLVSYVTEDSITLSVDVSQEDIIALAVGDSVSIAFTAYPEKLYEGEVTAITTTATSEHATTISYPVTIKVIGDTSRLFAGMTGDVTFVTEEKKEVLYTTKKAIVEENGKTYVYQKDKSGKMKLTEVTTGFTDGVNIEIVEGLEKGAVIYIKSKVTGDAEVEEKEA